MTGIGTVQAGAASLTQAASPRINQAASPWVDEANVSVRLISASNATGITTGIKTGITTGTSGSLIFGLEFQLAENWKVYWRSPGDAGYPPVPDWSKSENISSAIINWPAPVRFSVLGFETLGYKGEVVYPISVTAERPGEAVTLAGEVDFLACAEICIPMLVDLSLRLPPGEATPSSFAHLINKYSVRVPGDGTAHGLSSDKFILYPATPERNPYLGISVSSAPGLPFNAPDVFMEGPDGLAYAKPVLSFANNAQQAELTVEIFNTSSSQLIAGETRFTATVIDGERFAELSLIAQAPLPGASPTTTATSDMGDPGYTLLSILAIAFLGGLILNLMPCVLPVLSIKLLGVVGHGGGELKTIRYSFLASSAGIITSFLMLGGALAGLKSAGAAIGWGIQFQQPWFLIIMAIIITVFACNLLGWFEFSLPDKLSDAAVKGSGNSSMGGHFATGMLATLLATPCSAPFLGTAVSFALSRGTPEIMMIFCVLGLGLSTPYLLIALAPNLAKSLPKPGNWMITLRRVLGIALIGTAIWLISVLNVQVGWIASSFSSAAIVGIAIILYMAHRFTNPTKHIRATAIAALSIFALASPMAAPLIFSTTGTASAKPIDQLWQPFLQAEIAKHIDEGHVVFVDVTADWCITCQVNKTFVLANGAVFDQLNSPDVIAMQADWTLPDETISHYLASFARYGIPFNAVYGPAAPYGIALPELLTKGEVLDALRKARG